MAEIYVDSNAGGAGTGADWANAYLTLKAAAEAAGTAAGDNIWVAHNHAETQASALTITFKGTGVSPTKVICVDSGGSVPPVAADIRDTATVTTTGNSSIVIGGPTQGSNYIEGITFNAGTGAVAAVIQPTNGAIAHLRYKNCNFRKLGTTGIATAITLSSSRSINEFENCDVEFGSTGDGIRSNGPVIWKGGTITGATIPTALFSGGGSIAGDISFYGFDFSPLAGGTIVNADAQTGFFSFFNCKLHSTTVLCVTPVPPIAAAQVVAVNCDGGDTNYRTEKYTAAGTQSVETTIVRSGGATNGTTPISWKIATDADAEFLAPFESLPITIWNASTGSRTVTIYGYWNDAAVPTNAQIWIEAEYLGTSGFPISSFISSGPATVLTAGSNITEDTTSTWGGGDTTTRFEMAVTFTANEIGPIALKVFAAEPSKTFYIDPEPVISGVTVSKSFILAPGVYVNELSSGGGGG